MATSHQHRLVAYHGFPEGFRLGVTILLHGSASVSPDGTPLYYIPPNQYTVTLEADAATDCAPSGTTTYDHVIDYADSRPQIQLVWDAARGAEPQDLTASPGAALRDPATGELATWRIRPGESGYWHTGQSWQDVPVRLYVAERRVYWNDDGTVAEDLRPVPDVELCIGTLHQSYDPASDDYPGDITVTCDDSPTGEVTITASTEPETALEPGVAFEGEVGPVVGLKQAPEEGGEYVLVAEPVDLSFRRGDAWQLATRGLRPFSVVGGQFYDEQWQPLRNGIHLVGEKTVYFKMLADSSNATLDLSAAFEQLAGDDHEQTVVATRIGETGGTGVYVGQLQLSQAGGSSATGAKLLSYPLSTIPIDGEFSGTITITDPLSTSQSGIATSRLTAYRLVMTGARGIYRQDGSFDPTYLSEDDLGRVYVDWVHDPHNPSSLSWQADTQYVVFEVAVVPVQKDLPSSIKVVWWAEDPDDPSNDIPLSASGEPMTDEAGRIIDPNDYDSAGQRLSEPVGHDNRGNSDGQPTWESVSGHSLALLQGQNEHDREATVSTEVSLGSSAVRFNLTDVGGDNFRVFAQIADLDSSQAPSAAPEKTGVFSAWKMIKVEYTRMESADQIPLEQATRVFEDYSYLQFDVEVAREVPDIDPMGYDEDSALEEVRRYSTEEHGEFSLEGPGWFFHAAAEEYTPVVHLDPIELYEGQAEIVGPDTIRLLDGSHDPGTASTLKIYDAETQGEHVLYFIADVRENGTLIRVVPSYYQPIENPQDWTDYDLPRYGFPIGSEWHVTVSSPGGQGTKGLSVTDGENDKFTGRAIIFTEGFAETIDTSVHELTHCLGFAHMCGNHDVTGAQACAMNYSWTLILDSDNVPIPWSNYNRGHQLCAEHVRAIRDADLSDESQGRDLGWR